MVIFFHNKVIIPTEVKYFVNETAEWRGFCRRRSRQCGKTASTYIHQGWFVKIEYESPLLVCPESWCLRIAFLLRLGRIFCLVLSQKTLLLPDWPNYLNTPPSFLKCVPITFQTSYLGATSKMDSWRVCVFVRRLLSQVSGGSQAETHPWLVVSSICYSLTSLCVLTLAKSLAIILMFNKI